MKTQTCLRALQPVIIAFALVSISAYSFGVTIELYPSGDQSGLIDAQNIENALTGLPAGGTLKLSSGIFYVSRPIIVDGFEGTLRGSGMEKTAIEAVRKGPEPGEGFSLASLPPPYPPQIPIMMILRSLTGEINVEDITFQCLDPKPTNLWKDYDPSVDYESLNCFVELDGSGFHSCISNVRFVGSAGDFFNKWNTWHAFRTRDIGLSGFHEVKDCEFIDIAVGPGIFGSPGNSSNTTIHITNNLLAGPFFMGIRMWSFRSSEVLIEDNDIRDGWQLGIELNNISYATVRDNHVYENRIGIRATNTDVDLVDNNISYNIFPGVVLFYDSKAYIVDNEISDNGGFGIYVWNGPEVYILDNDIKNNRAGLYVNSKFAQQWGPKFLSVVHLYDNDFEGNMNGELVTDDASIIIYGDDD